MMHFEQYLGSLQMIDIAVRYAKNTYVYIYGDCGIAPQHVNLGPSYKRLLSTWMHAAGRTTQLYCLRGIASSGTDYGRARGSAHA